MPLYLNLQAEVLNQETERALSLSRDLLKGLRYCASKEDPSNADSLMLNVETDFYDPTTGLHSEGVWHNCLTGIASLKLASLSESNDDLVLDAIHIADSLWKFSWDGTSFRRRAYSGLWDHAFASAEHDDQSLPHQVNYYRESGEHRCIQHGIALIFWSRIVNFFKRSNQEVYYFKYSTQYKEISRNFVNEYWSESNEKWHTTSKSQGGGNLLRPSASWGKPTDGVTAETNRKYYRAVDQAVALLACLEVLSNNDGDVGDQEFLLRIIDKTCTSLLSKDGFGYGIVVEGKGDYSATRSYVGLKRNRNFWHDGWAVLALASCAKSGRHDWTTQSLEKIVKCHLQSRYGTNEKGDLVWHWAPSEKPVNENVRYCGDNALWYAICRTLNDKAFPEWGNISHAKFWSFVSELESHSPDGTLVAVADVYPQVRLHPNTELAVLVTWSL